MAIMAMNAQQVLDALGIDFKGIMPNEIVIRLEEGEAKIEFYDGMIINGGKHATKEES